MMASLPTICLPGQRGASCFQRPGALTNLIKLPTFRVFSLTSNHRIAQIRGRCKKKRQLFPPFYIYYMETFIMCALCCGLVGLGVAIGVLVENTRQAALDALRKMQEEKIATSADYLNFFVEVTQEQNKKLDTLIRCRDCFDPDVTQDIPVIEQ